MEKRLQKDPLMGSLGRYSSLPDRHLHKQKTRSDVDKFMKFGPKEVLSCYEVKELKESNVSDCTKDEKKRFGNRVGSIGRDVVHGDAYPDMQLITQHCVTVQDSVDEKDYELNSEVGKIEESTTRTNPFHGKYANLPLGGSLKTMTNIRSELSHTDAQIVDRVNSTRHEIDAESVCGVRENDDDDIFDRSAVDDFVMKMVPSFGRYTSLPPKRLFQPSTFYSATEEENLKRCVTNRVDLHRVNKLCGADRFGQGLGVDHVGQLNLNAGLGQPSCQLKSSSCFDIGRPLEPNPAWLSFQSFDDTIREFATDSAYHTSDSLKMNAFSLSKEELQMKIEQFNMNPDGLKIEMELETDVYHGCIRVLIDLVRPVDIRTSLRPPSIFDLHETAENEDDTASFFLPRSYLATIRISSETTADQVIRDVLNKYNITNNSGRFALFEKINRKSDEGHLTESSATVYLRKLSNRERPLELCLHSVDDSADVFEERHFLLRENDKDEILWEAFSLPELGMFLEILLREEESCIKAIRKRYMSLRNALEQRLNQECQENYDLLVQLQSSKGSVSSP